MLREAPAQAVPVSLLGTLVPTTGFEGAKRQGGRAEAA